MLQRVREASVSIDEKVVGAIGVGYLLLVGLARDDGPAQVDWMAAKVQGLRLFPDEAGLMNRALDDVGGSVLVISQFTLYGDARKGRRPSFVGAARPEDAERLYDRFVAALRDLGLTVETGVFAAAMNVSLVNDGPVTLILER